MPNMVLKRRRLALRYVVYAIIWNGRLKVIRLCKWREHNDNNFTY